MAAYPQTVAEAERRFYATFPHIHGWAGVADYLDAWELPAWEQPRTVETWIALARVIRRIDAWVAAFGDTNEPDPRLNRWMVLHRPGPRRAVAGAGATGEQMSYRK